ncbi:type 4 pilus major pilin [Noviherbaspirillum sp.]|jgi:type II secretory pathway pseudopilin PulG|uniref:type 4 pilus major pilin n=1 Tax=Noviherbaspirillum sp. TaxID=1926288 RepID=UPI0025E99B23|nr:type 4 pilus major pilin [Noviherbaspirillum sp.]
MRKVFCGNDIAPKQLRLQRGASLLEGIAYLGIAAIVILGAVSLLTGAFGSAQTNRAAEELTSLRTAIQKLYMGQGNAYVDGNMLNNLNAAGLIPATLRHVAGAGAAGVTATNAWGGAVTVVGNGATFTVTYADVPQEACVNILLSTSGWTTVAVGQNAVALPVTPTNAAGACAVGNNNLVFTAG